MTTPKDTGGPAFPTSFNPDYPTELVGGMTLRDAFAMHVLPAYFADGTGYSAQKEAAKWAYEMADAMLEARK
jgi:hypothetical protein